MGGSTGDLSGTTPRIRHVRLRRPLLGTVVLATAVLVSAVAGAANGDPGTPRSRFQTSKTLYLGAGRATRTFTFRERAGVILLNRLKVLHGVRARVDARIPNVAGTRVSAAPDRKDRSCRREGRFDVCTQGEEWCPMPEATWQFRLVKLSGPAGPVRFDYVVASPPSTG